MRGYGTIGKGEENDFFSLPPTCCQHCGSLNAPPYDSVPRDNLTDGGPRINDFDSKTGIGGHDDSSSQTRTQQPQNKQPQIHQPQSQQSEDVGHDGSYSRPITIAEYLPKPPRGLNIVIQIVGTAVDVEPFLALGWVLKHKNQHRVRFATHASFRSLVEGVGLEFFSIPGNPERLKSFMTKKPELLSSMTAWNDVEAQECTTDIYQIMLGCWRSCYEVGDGTVERQPDVMYSPQMESDPAAFKPFVADVIIANPPSFAHIHCAQKMGVPVHIISTPIHASLYALAITTPGTIGEVFSDTISYATLEMLNWRWLSNTINKFRRKALNLEAVRFASRPKVFNTLAEVGPMKIDAAGDLGRSSCTEGVAEFAVNTFHHQMQLELAKCSLDASRVAVWRVKNTPIVLSALSAVVILDSGLLKIKDLRILRHKEHNFEEGPFGPVAGTVAAVMSMVGDMSQGFMDFPREIARAVDDKPKQGRNQPPVTGATPLIREYYGTPPDQQVIYPSLETSSSIPQISRTRTHESRRVLNGTVGAAFGTSKGLGRIIMAGFKSPFDVTLGAARGFHNAPKLYGDPTVRDVYRITGFASGIKAAGKEIGLGFYDAFSGLVTQPIDGKKKGGALGLAKGIGWGVGGLILKPVAGVIGVVGYTYEGVNQEIQKLFGSKADTHMAASRLAQGLVEFNQAAEEERAAILDNWHAMGARV